VALPRRSSAKLQTLHAHTRRQLFQLLVCRASGNVDLQHRCAQPSATILPLAQDQPAARRANAERSPSAQPGRGSLRSGGWFCWWNESLVPPSPSGEQTTVAPLNAVQEAELKLQAADFLAADQLVQKWLSERFGGGTVAVLSCGEWLLLARLAFLRDDVHGGLMFLDRAAQVRLTEAAHSAGSEESRRFATYELLLRAAAATMSGCPELSHGHLENAEMLGSVEDPQELQLTMICRALVELAIHRCQSACQLFRASLLLRQAPAVPRSADGLLRIQHELAEALQLLAETQRAASSN